MIFSESDRISKKYRKEHHERIEHYSWMFKEDLCRNIVPSNYSPKAFVNCILEPENKDLEKLLYELLPSAFGRHHGGLNEIILGSIQFIANQIVHHGYIILELVRYQDFDDTEHFKLENVLSSEFVEEKDHIVQVIPKNNVILFNEEGEQFDESKPILIPKSKCLIIEFPEALGGRLAYKKFLDDFESFGKLSPMMNYFNNTLSGQPGYDLTEHQRLHLLELWKMSRIFKWHHRSNSENEFSGFYYIYRYLNFIKLKMILRDYLVEQLSRFIAEFSEHVNKKTVLKMEGLITINQVDEKINEWITGTMNPGSLSEVL